MNLGYYNSYLEVDLGKVINNLEKVKAHIGTTHSYLPVLKANAYGTGLIKMADYFTSYHDIDIIGVAQLCEAVQIREAKIDAPQLLLLGAAPFHALEYAVKYRVQVPVFTERGACLLSEAVRACGEKVIQVHIKIETGMNRIGVEPGEPLEKMLDVIKRLGNIEIAGVFTHFSTADHYNDAFTYEQFARFKTALRQISARGIRPRYVHACNSAATIWFREAYGTHVRSGALHLGYSTMADDSDPLSLEEALSWRASIVNIRTIYPGESVGYGQVFQPGEPTRVATVNVGAADGLYRPLGQKFAPVIVNGTRTHYVGICMDQCFIDVNSIPCALGDTVTLFGTDPSGLTLSPVELARFIGQSRSSMHCYLSERVKRIYV